MHIVLRLPYAAAGAAVRVAARLAPHGGGKARSSLHARRGIRSRYAHWGAEGREPARPLLWLHAPSVGEGLQARPVIAALKRSRPDLQIAYTFFSPSAERFARALGADFCDYLPFDTRADADAALDALRPSALVFSKLDVWPLFTERAARRGVKLGLISATLSASSARSSMLGSLLLHDAYRSLNAVGAISSDDAARLARLGVREPCITVTGDARYDEAWARAQPAPGDSSSAAALLAALQSERPTLVAGSTWPADEAVLLDAWRAVRARIAGARLVIAPHEPAAERVRALANWASSEGLRGATLDDPNASRADVVIVNRVGVLAGLYALADAAYVGGGFHSAGLHSVIEPAAHGVPVLFGPRHAASRDAALLLECGGGFSAPTTAALEEQLTALLAGTPARALAGTRARELVHSGLGAAARSATLVERLLPPET